MDRARTAPLRGLPPTVNTAQVLPLLPYLVGDRGSIYAPDSHAAHPTVPGSPEFPIIHT